MKTPPPHAEPVLPPPPHPVTMKEVASRAGVGLGTVSRVLNDSPLVRPTMAEHVRRVMAELDYTPPPLEKRRKKSKDQGFGAVGVILTGMGGLKWISDFAPIYAYALAGVESALREAGLGCMVHHAPDFKALERMFQSAPRVDGFLILSGSQPLRRWPEELLQYPAVTLLGAPDRDWCDRVTYDNARVGETAAEHLLSHGVRHAATLGNGTGNAVFLYRMRSFAQKIADCGGSCVNLSSESICRAGPTFHEANDRAVGELIDELLRSRPAVEGLFITADMIAPAVYRQLERRGVRPGRDLRIVSCNNEKAYLSHLDPQPAVIDILAETVGSRAVSHLLWRMEHRDAPRTTLLIDPELILPPG